MFIRPCFRKKGRKRHAYWALVESVRTERGPRQRVVGYLGGLPEKRRGRVKLVAGGERVERQASLFPGSAGSSECVEVQVGKVRTENPRGFGGPWLGLQLVKMLGLDGFLAAALSDGGKSTPWSLTAQILILCRLLNPSSELHIAEHFWGFPVLAGGNWL